MKIGERTLIQSFVLFLSPLLYHNLHGFDGRKIHDSLILVHEENALDLIVRTVVITINNRHLLDVNTSIKGCAFISRIKHDGKGVLDCA